MALGGLASLFAGLPQGLADAAERRRRDEEMQMRQFAILQDLKNKQDQQQAAGAAFGALSSGAGEVQMPQPAGMPGGAGQPMQLPSVPDTGGAFPRPQMPAARPIAAPNMGGGMSAGGAIPARGTAERERLKSLIYSNESGGRNVDQGVVPPGGGYNPSVGRVTGPSSASGYGQITDSTWRDTPTGRSSGVTHAKDAPFEAQDKAVDDLIDKRGVSPWAPYNPKLRKDLESSGLAPVVQEAQKTAQTATQGIHPELMGRMNLQALAKQIDKANPGASPVVKMMALEQVAKLLAPEEKAQWQAMMQQNRQDIQLALKDMQIQNANARQDKTIAAAGERQDKAIAARKPSGDTLIGDDEAKMAAEQYWAGDKSAMQGWGRGAQGSANLAKIRHFVTVMGKEEGKDGKDLAAAVAEFEGLKSGERTLGNLTARLGTGLAEAEIFAPIVLELSNKVDRTQYKDINSLLLAAESRTGDENVVRYGVALNALISAYSQVLVRGGVPTDSARAQAKESFDKAYSQGQIGALVDQIMVEIKGANKAPGKVKQEMRGGFTGKPAEGSPSGAPKVLKFDKDGNPVQ